MGAAASAQGAEGIVNELSSRGVEHPKLNEIIGAYFSSSALPTEDNLDRDHMLQMVRQIDRDALDAQIAMGLMQLTEKERNRPSEQQRLKKLMRRRKTHEDLKVIVGDILSSKAKTLEMVYGAYPPLHQVDHSVDTQLCESALACLSIPPGAENSAIVQLTVEMMRQR